MTAVDWLLRLPPVVAIVPLGMRWLLVAQREHYIAGSASRFAARWLTASVPNVALGGSLVLLAAGSWFDGVPGWIAAILAAAIAAAWPLGLPVRGWTITPRLARVMALGLLLDAAIVTLLAMTFGPSRGVPGAAVLVLVLSAPLVDVSLGALAPLERRLQRPWIEKAGARLRSVAPRVVAITGSYGKTTTKELARRVLSVSGPTLASPASFNNAMGLSRAINEHLAPGTAWFVAEMGTYGPGEIAALCDWLPPEIAAITAIGPVHLERFGSLDATLAAKAEIAGRARVVVLNCDDARLADLASRLAAGGTTVIRCGTREGLDVVVRDRGAGWDLVVGGDLVGTVTKVAFPTNLAVAVGIGVAAGVDRAGIPGAFAEVETPRHRQSVVKGPAGFWIIDDTFNSNPAGAAAALQTLDGLDSGRKVVVTPGMVELGPDQEGENREFASRAARVADDILVVKRSNRRALLTGASGHDVRVQVHPDRESAVGWVRANLGPGDAVLYENDLPAHYP